MSELGLFSENSYRYPENYCVVVLRAQLKSTFNTFCNNPSKRKCLIALIVHCESKNTINVYCFALLDFDYAYASMWIGSKCFATISFCIDFLSFAL